MANLQSLAFYDTFLDARKSNIDYTNLPTCPKLSDKKLFIVWFTKFCNYLYGIHRELHKFVQGGIPLPKDPRTLEDFEDKKKKMKMVKKYQLKLQTWKDMDTLMFRIMNYSLIGNHDEILNRANSY